MRLIIAGGRTRHVLPWTIDSILQELNWRVERLVCGMAQGIDTCAFQWAEMRHIPIDKFPADWEKHGTRAGPLRNEEMAKVADALLAFPSPKSRGTYDMIRRARAHGLRVEVRP